MADILYDDGTNAGTTQLQAINNTFNTRNYEFYNPNINDISKIIMIR
jgi:hypothetical protein